jgi:hypothetical protein
VQISNLSSVRRVSIAQSSLRVFDTVEYLLDRNVRLGDFQHVREAVKNQQRVYYELVSPQQVPSVYAPRLKHITDPLFRHFYDGTSQFFQCLQPLNSSSSLPIAQLRGSFSLKVCGLALWWWCVDGACAGGLVCPTATCLFRLLNHSGTWQETTTATASFSLTRCARMHLSIVFRFAIWLD